MAMRQAKKRRAKRKPTASKALAITASGDSSAPQAHAGRRLRVSVDNPTLSLFKGLTIIPPPSVELLWGERRIDQKTLDELAPIDLLALLRQVSPDVSRAVWDFLRLMNPGYEYHAYVPGTQTEDERGKAALTAFIAQLETLHGSFDILCGKINMGAFMRGAFFAELVLDEAGRLPIDIATPDPRWFHFRAKNDPVRGTIYVLVQYQPGKPAPVDLDYPTIKYLPVDAMPSSPYGEGLAHASLGTTTFVLAILHDLRRVVQQQGWPRIDLAVNMERLLQSMPPEKAADEKKRKEWLESVYSEIEAIYGKLDADEAYVHSDTITVNRPVGTVDSSSLGAIDGLISALERQQVRALKTMPLLFGINEAASETHANRQWEVHVAGIKALQHLHEKLLEGLFTIALQVQGIQATVRFVFSELRAAELMRDAQVDQLRAQNAMYKYQAGWFSQKEASLEGADKEVPDQEEPRVPGMGAGPGVASPGSGANPEPGQGRQVPEWYERACAANYYDVAPWEVSAGMLEEFVLQEFPRRDGKG